jgi:hypothetical protein
VPSAEYARLRVLRVLRVSEEALSSVATSVGEGIPSRESMMELITAGLAGFALTRFGERRFDGGLSGYSGPGCELDRRGWSHCWRSDCRRKVAVMADVWCQWVGWNKRQACMRNFGTLDRIQTFVRLSQRANALHGCPYWRSLLRSGTEVDYGQRTARLVARAPGGWTILEALEGNDHAASTHSMHDTGTNSVL